MVGDMMYESVDFFLSLLKKKKIVSLLFVSDVSFNRLWYSLSFG